MISRAHEHHRYWAERNIKARRAMKNQIRRVSSEDIVLAADTPEDYRAMRRDYPDREIIQRFDLKQMQLFDTREYKNV